MKYTTHLFALTLIFVLASFNVSENQTDINILSHEINPSETELKFYWKDKNGDNYTNFQTLKSSLEGKGNTLIFAMNGGMFNKELIPQGLYIEDGVTLVSLDTVQNGFGNFYLQPNGVFYLTNENIPVICKTSDFENTGDIKYATQSGPMLLNGGEIHLAFNKGSSNLNLRNGVGILPNGNLLFAMAKEEINFFDFARFFKQNGCRNALYLDGAISKTYLPSQNWKQLDGTFGVIIGVVE